MLRKDGRLALQYATILEYEFTKAFTELRLIDSKKISNAKFKNIIAQYDSVVCMLNSRWVKTDEDTVYTSLATFTLEWKYPVNFLFAVARRMEELGISEFPDQKSRLASFCADIHCESMLNYKFFTHSRMVTVRDRYIDLMLTEPKGSLLFEAEQRAFLEGLGIVSQLVSHMTITMFQSRIGL